MIPLIPLIGKLILGEVINKTVGSAKEPIKEIISKGLIRSSTAKVATGALGAKLVVILTLPLPDHYKWLLVGAMVAEWGVNLYQRIKTKDSV